MQIRSGFSKVEVAVVLLCGVLLAALLLPNIEMARDAARRTQSKNNLKQIGLAFHNYHDVYSGFPVGANVDENDRALQGWNTQIIPFMESTPLYAMIEHELPWDHPLNVGLMRCKQPSLLLPGASETMTKDGFGVTHYPGNPNVFHRNESVSLDDMTGGVSNNWLAGEAVANAQPWAYPFNWRELSLPFNDKTSYGNPIGDGVQIVLADGSVRFLVNDVSPEVVASLAGAEPVADSILTQLPKRRLQPVVAVRTETVRLVSGDGAFKQNLDAFVAIDASDVAYRISFTWPNKGDNPVLSASHIKKIGDQCPGVRILDARRWSPGEDLTALSAFPELKIAILGEVVFNDDTIAVLSGLQNLSLCRCRLLEEHQEAFREAMLPCQVIFRTVQRRPAGSKTIE